VLTDCRIHATIPASDLGRARKWYADKLGFEHVRQLPGGLMYDAADTTRFIIYPTPNAGKSPNTLMGFATDDIDAEVRDLKARGVVFEEYDYPTLKTVDGIATVGPTRSAWFRDSEGNIIGVVQLPPA
jgi:catechol 2,3-dioxygenase-like lactoylglutathione lyase family enzyme